MCLECFVNVCEETVNAISKRPLLLVKNLFIYLFTHLFMGQALLLYNNADEDSQTWNGFHIVEHICDYVKAVNASRIEL